MASKGTLLAVDVGGTDIKSALLSADAAEPSALSVLTRLRRPTPRGADGDATALGIVRTVADLVTELGAQSPTGGIDAVGVVVPGVVDAGVGVFSANLGWRNFPFAVALGEAIDLPVVFGHDVASCGLAEHRMGAAAGCRNAVVMPIGTGIAAALIIDGELRTGGGYAGEVGHVDIGHGEPCGCGARGCLEAIASTGAIARRYGARVGRKIAGCRRSARRRAGGRRGRERGVDRRARRARQGHRAPVQRAWSRAGGARWRPGDGRTRTHRSAGRARRWPADLPAQTRTAHRGTG